MGVREPPELALLRLLVEAVQTGVVVVDSPGRVTLVNAEIQRLLAYGHGELLAALPLRLTLEPTDARDGPALLATVVDAAAGTEAEAERADSERRRRQAQRLDSLGNLAGGIAHDFNNVLATVKSLCELALEAPGAPSDLLDRVLLATRKGQDLVERVLVFSRGRAIDVEQVDLGAATREAVDALRGSMDSGIEVEVQIAATPPIVRSDALAIHQIVSNLLSNAADATSARGRVAIEVSTVELDEATRGSRRWPRGGYGRIVVRDWGVGMDAATLDRCLDPFFTTKGGRYKGLGLAVVHGLTHELGGDVAIDSAPGRGTTVTVVIPLAQATRADVGAPQSTRTPTPPSPRT